MTVKKTLSIHRFLLLAAALLWAPLLRAEEPPAAPAVAASTGTAEAPSEPEYVFTVGSRDPFVPLVGAAADVGESMRSADKEPGAFNAASLELKGILRMPTGRWAVLSSPGGDTYVVENGKVRDAKKKPVEGYVGFIKEKSLVLIGPNNQVTELKLKRDQQLEDQKKPK
jgi:hypothetical protein